MQLIRDSVCILPCHLASEGEGLALSGVHGFDG